MTIFCKITLDNLLSGLLGGVVTLIGSVILSRIANAIRLDRTRRAIMVYLEVAKMKLSRYIEDTERAIKHLNYEEVGGPKGMDSMPVLNSEVLKSYSHVDLMSISGDEEIYSRFLSLMYSIEYLKADMPYQVTSKYLALSQKHNEEKGFITREAQREHYMKCGFLKQKRSEIIGNMQGKIKTASSEDENTAIILSGLSGGRWKWTRIYFWRQ